MIDYKALSLEYSSVDDKKDKNAPTDERVHFVQNRFTRMAISKNPIRQIWDGTQGLYYANDWEWIVKGEGYDRPVRFTTLRDVIKNLTDVYMRTPPDIILKAKDEDDKHLVIGKKAYIEHIRELPHQKKTMRQVVEDMFFFGKGFSREMYFDFDDDGYEGIASRRISPRDIFVDENANVLHDELGIDGARDCIVRSFIPLSTFKKKAKKYGWDYTGVIATNFFTTEGMDYKVTNAREVEEKTQTYGVKTYEYMNWCEDIYVVVANDKCAYEGKLSECQGTKRIPVTDYTFEPRNDSLWGTTVAQLLAPHIYAKDMVFNLNLMNYKLTVQPVLAVSGDFGFNKKLHPIGPGQVWQAGGNMNGKLGDHIQPILFGNPGAQRGGDDMLNYISNELSVAARTDLRNLEFHPDTTATQVLSNNQSMNAHNETVENINEVEAECVKTKIWLDLMESFMDDKDEEGKMRKIGIKNYLARKNETDRPEFVEKRGAEDEFDLTSEMIDVPCEVVVVDKRSEVAKGMEKVGRMMQAYPVLFNIAQVVPELAQKLDGVGMAEQLIEAIGLEMERSFKKGMNAMNDEFETLEQEILLGNEVVFDPEETREDATARMNFLLYLRYDKLGNEKQKWTDMDNLSKKVWQKALEDTFASIKKPRMQQIQQENSMTAPSMPVQPQQGSASPIAQPSNISMTGPQDQLKQKAGSMASQLQP